MPAPLHQSHRNNASVGGSAAGAVPCQACQASFPLTLPLLQGSTSPLPGSTPKPAAQKTPQGATAIPGLKPRPGPGLRLSASVSCFRDQQPLGLPPRCLTSMRVLEAQPTRAEGFSRFTDGDPGRGRARDSLPATRLRAGWTCTSRPPSRWALGWASLSWGRGPGETLDAWGRSPEPEAKKAPATRFHQTTAVSVFLLQSRF